MAHSRLPAALERDQGTAVLRREWRFERVGRVVLALILSAALAGAFGDGVLATAESRSADGAVTLRYERIVRRNAPSQLEIRLAPARSADSVVVVSLDEQYLAAMDVQRVMPQPVRVRGSSGRVDFHLLRLDPSRAMTIRVFVRAIGSGSYRATLETGGHVMEFRQRVLP
jgi:hypothetical protein